MPVLADITKVHFAHFQFDLIVDAVSLSQLSGPDIALVISKAKDWLVPGGRMFSKLAAEPFDRRLVIAPLTLVNGLFVGKAFDGFSYVAQLITGHAYGNIESSYWLVHAKKDGESYD